MNYTITPTAPQRHSFTAQQRNNFLNLARYIIMLVFCFFFYNLIHAQSGFLPSVVPNKHFPKPRFAQAIPTAYIAPGSVSGLSGYTFYNQRNGGSCYNQTFDFDGIPGKENVSVWSINHNDVIGLNNSVAYEVTEPGTGNILYRGYAYYVGGDIANLQVGIIYENFQHILIVAYWSYTNEIRLKRYIMQVPNPSNPSGLVFDRDDLIYTITSPAALNTAQHISLDCSDFDNFVIAWEEMGAPIRMRAYNTSAGAYGPAHILAGSTTFSRLPDIALSKQVGIIGVLTAHIAYVETTAPFPSIHKCLVDAGSLMSSTPIMTPEDVEPLTKPFGSYWDDFQLKIDAPDHYSTAQSNWAYTYFNDDANKINVKICNQTAMPIYKTYTVNDGLLLPPSGIALADMTNAGNAFPSIAYNKSGDGMYVAWYTNYDPTLPGPINNQLYNYTAQSQGYVSVYLKEDGSLMSNEYNRMDDNYMNNRIGQGIDPMNPQTHGYYPKTCFSKHNEGEKLMSLFSSHCALTDLIFRFAGRDYGESDSIAPVPLLFPIPGDTNLSYINYDYASYNGLLYTGTSAFLSQKQVKWYPSSPLFRKLQEDSSSINSSTPVQVLPNPFSQTLQVISSASNLHIKLYDAQGKLLFSLSGSSAELNTALTKQANNLATGTYLLQVQEGKQAAQIFKLSKL